MATLDIGNGQEPMWKSVCEKQAQTTARLLIQSLYTFLTELKTNVQFHNVVDSLKEQFIESFQKAFESQVQQLKCERSSVHVNGGPRIAFHRSVSAIENGHEKNGSNNSLHHINKGLKNVMSFPQLFTDTASESDTSTNPKTLTRSISSQGLSGSQPITKDDKQMKHNKMKGKILRNSFRKRKKSKLNLLEPELSSASVSESTELAEDSPEDLPVFDDKANFVTNVWQKIRKGSLKKPKDLLSGDKPGKDDGIVQEGFVNYLSATNSTAGDTLAFQRARLVLRRTKEAYQVELFTPCKSTKPKHVVVGKDIVEVRRTTSLEFPDTDYAFVIKAVNDEYVVKTSRKSELTQWLADIDELSISYGHKRSECYELDHHPYLPMNIKENSANSSLASGSQEAEQCSSRKNSSPTSSSGADAEKSPNDLEERCKSLAENNVMLGNWESSMASECLAPAPPTDGEDEEPTAWNIADLKKCPWYHGVMTRLQAADLVVQNGAEGHGIFLVRESESRPGDYVLSFNFQGKAKHLRMTLGEQGQCCVQQHIRFSSIFKMLEHFRLYPIPLDSGGAVDVYLSNYVINFQADVDWSKFKIGREKLLSQGISVDGSDGETPSTSTATTPADPTGSNGQINSFVNQALTQEPENGKTQRTRAVDNQYAFS